jgi:P2-related tail formation protein
MLHRSKWFIFSTPAQPRFSFERTIEVKNKYADREQVFTHISSNVRQS